jgi:hypothetical protein
MVILRFMGRLIAVGVVGGLSCVTGMHLGAMMLHGFH